MPNSVFGTYCSSPHGLALSAAELRYCTPCHAAQHCQYQAAGSSQSWPLCSTSRFKANVLVIPPASMCTGSPKVARKALTGHRLSRLVAQPYLPTASPLVWRSAWGECRGNNTQCKPSSEHWVSQRKASNLGSRLWMYSATWPAWRVVG